MANEIARSEPNFYEKYGDAATTRNIVGRLLKFTKFGEYCAGIENEVIPVDTALIAYMPSLAAGYVRWAGGRPAAAEMGYVGEGFVPPKRNDLGFNDAAEWESDDKGNKRDPWQFTNSLIFIDLGKNLLYTFNTSSRGGLDAIGGLSKIYGRHMKVYPRDLPMIKIGVGSYKHTVKAYGEIRYPIFMIINDKWLSVDELPPFEGLPPFIEPQRQIETTLRDDTGDEVPF